jgi:hypothetical protein
LSSPANTSLVKILTVSKQLNNQTIMQVSLDGFIEGPGGDMSCMAHDDETEWADLFDMLLDVDLFLPGRVMWPDYRNYWKGYPGSGRSKTGRYYY